MGKVRRLGNEKERGGREMYSGKLAPHKSGTQSSKEEAVKNGGHTDTRAHQTRLMREKRRNWMGK